jgi:hypothetical protein
MHPRGLTPRLADRTRWWAHLLERLHRQIVATGDPALQARREESAAYPVSVPLSAAGPDTARLKAALAEVVVPFQIPTEVGLLSFISTTTVFGTPVEVTQQKLAVESFFPTDAQTSDALSAIAG